MKMTLSNLSGVMTRTTFLLILIPALLMGCWSSDSDAPPSQTPDSELIEAENTDTADTDTTDTDSTDTDSNDTDSNDTDSNDTDSNDTDSTGSGTTTTSTTDSGSTTTNTTGSGSTTTNTTGSGSTTTNTTGSDPTTTNTTDSDSTTTNTTGSGSTTTNTTGSGSTTTNTTGSGSTTTNTTGSGSTTTNTTGSGSTTTNTTGSDSTTTNTTGSGSTTTNTDSDDTDSSDTDSNDTDSSDTDSSDTDSSDTDSSDTDSSDTDSSDTDSSDTDSDTSDLDEDEPSFSDDWPDAGTADAICSIPEAARAKDSSLSNHIVGHGTPESCTSNAFVSAVAAGGVITFDCGPAPVTLTLTETAKIFNNTGPEIVIDGGGLVTLSGNGRHRILYMNTCDENQEWTTSHCNNQDHPRLTVQNLTFINGHTDGEKPGGGGAIFVRGGRFKIVNCRFFKNTCDEEGPDVGGAAVRVFDQYNDQPVYVVGSTFGGRSDLGNIGSNGGALSSIGVSFTVINSVMSHNQAIGYGANPARSNTPGGGSGGAIYNDGNTFTLNICGSSLTENTANEGGGAIFFVSNDKTGTLRIDRSILNNNPSLGFESRPGIFVIAKDINITK